MCVRDFDFKGRNDLFAFGPVMGRDAIRQRCVKSDLSGANLLSDLRELTAVVLQFRFMVTLTASSEVRIIV